MTDVAIVEDWDGGFGWLAHPTERLERASHAIAGDDGYWLIDPVAGDGVEPLIADRGSVAGIVITLDRHLRDAPRLARTFGCPVSLPMALEHLAVPTSTATIDGFVDDTGWHVRPVIDRRGWHEVALVAPDGKVARISEAVGTAAYYRAPGERLGVHPVCRLVPPRAALAGLTPHRLLVGHGRGLATGGAEALTDALVHARRRAPRAYCHGVRQLFGW